MAEPQKLAKFTVLPAGDGFSLHIEDDSGATLELIATRDQIDLIADDLDERLSLDDADEIGEEEVEVEEDEDDEPAKPKT